MSGCYKPSILILEYFESLISQIDIYTEMRIIKCKNQPLRNQIEKTFDSTYRSQAYTIDRSKFSLTTSEATRVEDYLNEVRQKAVDEIKRLKNETFDFYNANKMRFSATTTNLRSQLFAKKYCFLVNIERIRSGNRNFINRNSSLFTLHTVITDFYLSESDVEYLQSEFIEQDSIKNQSKITDQVFTLAYELNEYFNADGNSNGCEVIHVRKNTHRLFQIENNQLCERNLKLDIDLSATKSLCIGPGQPKISDDLSAYLQNKFTNLEYLSVYFTKIFGFYNLPKLVKLEIINCDLSEFDFNSLNSLSSLEILQVTNGRFGKSNNKPPLFGIDFKRLVNLKSIDLFDRAIRKVDFKGGNKFTKLKISEENLSKSISQQFFNGFNNLIELNLNNTYLKEIDFIDTYKLGSLEILSLSYNNIVWLRKGVFSKLKKLKSLNLDYNRIRDLVLGTFDGLECLENLDIRSNRICVGLIDEKVFEGLIYLKNLYF